MWLRQAAVSGGNLDGLEGARLLPLEPLHDVDLLRQLGGIGIPLRVRVGNGESGRALGSPLQKECSRLTETDTDQVYRLVARLFRGSESESGGDGEEMQS